MTTPDGVPIVEAVTVPHTCGDCGKPFTPTSDSCRRATNWCDACRNRGRKALAQFRGDTVMVGSVREALRMRREADLRYLRQAYAARKGRAG